MLKDAVAVIDFGTYKLTAMIGENGINKNFLIRAVTTVTHDAIDSENNINEDALYTAISDALKSVSSIAKAHLDRIYVGIPGYFLRSYNTDEKLFFNRRKKIRARDLTELYDKAVARFVKTNFSVISRSGVKYSIDGNIDVDNPVGMVSSSLSATVTLFAMWGKLKTMLDKIFSTLSVGEVIYIPAPLAEARLLFDAQERRTMRILFDVGYISSSLTLIQGDGAVFHRPFRIGGGDITFALYRKYNGDIDFDICERAKRKINLSLADDSGKYVVVYGDGPQYDFPVREANNLARGVIDAICEAFDRAIADSNVDISPYISVSLTGGGICYIRGAAEYLSKDIEMGVNIVTPKIAYMSKPDNTSGLSVLNYALNEEFL